LSGGENRTLQKVDKECLQSFKMWSSRRKEKIGWTDRVRNEEVLHTVKEEETSYIQ